MKQKSLFLAALLLLAEIPAVAQVSIGAGYVNSADRVKTSNTETQVNNANGFYGGLGFTLPIAGDLSVTPGVYYTYLTSGTANSVGGGILSWAGTTKEHYINVPVRLEYGAEILPNFRLFFFGGPTFSAGLASKTTLTGSVLGFSANTVIDNYKDTDNYGRYDILLGGGMGVDLAKRIRVTAGYDFGMLNRYTNSDNIVRHRNQLHAGVALLF